MNYIASNPLATKHTHFNVKHPNKNSKLMHTHVEICTKMFPASTYDLLINLFDRRKDTKLQIVSGWVPTVERCFAVSYHRWAIVYEAFRFSLCFALSFPFTISYKKKIGAASRQRRLQYISIERLISLECVPSQAAQFIQHRFHVNIP